MMKKLIQNSLLLCFLILIIVSCTKNVPGPKGDPGTPGGLGNTKQTSATVKLASSDWTFDGESWVTSVYLDDITSHVADKGEIRVYMQIDSAWWSLPYAVGDVFTEQSFKEGYLYLKRSKIHDGPPDNPGATTFRAVIFSPVM